METNKTFHGIGDPFQIESEEIQQPTERKLLINIKRIIHRLNVPRHIACHLVGDEHTHVHHKFVGIVIIVLGEVVIKFMGSFHNPFIEHTGIHEMIGMSFHAFGLTPFIESMLKKL